jgi:hypothetical protein
MNSWISHVKSFAKSKNISYKDAIKSKQCKDTYTKKGSGSGYSKDIMSNNMCEQILRDIAELQNEFTENQHYRNIHPDYYDTAYSRFTHLNDQWQHMLFTGRTDKIDLLERLIHHFQDLKSYVRQMKENIARQPVHATDVSVVHIPHTNTIERRPSTTGSINRTNTRNNRNRPHSAPNSGTIPHARDVS